ncbi:MAG TPA: tetratricopeptide repeat protein, partial [Candidatus Cybelea sp.]|nr:tetratricopeptide repeat protein [Candidatus Cybelea sp.]
AKLGDGNRALMDLDLALALDPDLPDANLYRGFLHLMLADDVHAVADLSRAAALKPEDGTIADGLGTAYLLGGDDDRAIASYDRAIALDPDLTDAYRGRASLQAAHGDVAAALAGLELAIRRQPAEAMNRRAKGVILYGAGSYADAANALRDALALDPTDAYSVILLDLAQRRADPAAATETEVRAQRLDLTRWPGPVVAFLMGRMSRADLLAAAAASPDARIVRARDCEATFYIAEADGIAGRTDAAKAGLRRAADTCPRGFDERLAAQAELARVP